jgi:dihydrolipoamide dehydrogenase
MNSSQRLLVIGAGPGGYSAAFNAADRGFNVTLVDRDPFLGGTCLSKGCIPSKALLHTAEVLREAQEAAKMGITFSQPHIDLDKLRTWKNNILSRLTSGLDQLCKQRKINFIRGTAKLTGSHEAAITTPDGSTIQIAFDLAILATGTTPVTLPLLPSSPRVWDSTSALSLPCIPPSLLVIGGGYIGLELGSVYSALGTKVTVVESLPQLLNGPDRDLADILARCLKKEFHSILTGTRAIRAEEVPEGIRVVLSNSQGKELSETYSHVLAAVGRRPQTCGLGLENTAIKTDARGFILVDKNNRTHEEGIFAIGDVAGNPLLAHKASFEAGKVIRIMAGLPCAPEEPTIPSVIFTRTQLAWAGLTEQSAKQNNIPVTVSRFPWAANGRALTMNRPEGVTKIIADPDNRRILGVGIIGAGAGELIAEGVLAIDTKMTADQLALAVHPHPTTAETLMEAAGNLWGAATVKPKTGRA